MKNRTKAFLAMTVVATMLMGSTVWAADGDDHEQGEGSAISHEEHDWTLDEILQEPDCIHEGLGRYVCSNGGEEHFHEDIIPATGVHQYVPSTTGTATCTEPGEITYTCKVCGDSYTEPVAQLGHLWASDAGEDWLVTKEPTCREVGEETDYCVRCGEIRVDEETEEPVTREIDNSDIPHTWDEWVTEKPATCNSEGLEVRWCMVCGEKQQQITDKLAPVWKLTSSVRQDCYTTIDTYTCELCGGKAANGKDDNDHVYTVENDSEVHTFKDRVIDILWEESENIVINLDTGAVETENCDEDGLVVYQCVYGHNDTDLAKHEVIVPAHGHVWGDWKVRYEAGAQNNKMGYWIRKCERCGETEERIAEQMPEELCEKEGHDFVPTETVEATANAEGYVVKTCTKCGKEEKEILPMLESGLAQDENGEWKYYENGEVAEDFTGIVDYNGGEFYVVNGDLADEAEGLNLIDGTWYFLADGKIQRGKDDVVSYDDHFFMIDNGELNEDANGLYDYDGGKFLFSTGKLRDDVNGLWQDFDGTWYFLANGQVQTQHHGVAEYDGAFFYVVGGKLASDFNGSIEYDGATFKVVAGQLYAA